MAITPEQVTALRDRVAVALQDLVGRAGELGDGERAALRPLVAAWNAQVAEAPTWLTAPELLAAGRALEAQLARLQAPETNGARAVVGSVLGEPSVGEVSDLLSAKDYETTQIANAGAACAAWAQKDPVAFGNWQGRTYDAKAAYDEISKGAHAIVDSVPHALWGYTPATGTWGDLLSALKPFHDLYAELVAAGCTVDLSKTPQPTQSDLDLKVYAWSGKALDNVEDLAHRAEDAVKGPGLMVAVGAGAAVLLILALRR